MSCRSSSHDMLLLPGLLPSSMELCATVHGLSLHIIWFVACDMVYDYILFGFMVTQCIVCSHSLQVILSGNVYHYQEMFTM